MKYKYCPDCKKAYIKSHLEKDKCIYCGRPCKVINVRMTGQYYLGYALMLAGALSVIILKFLNTNSLTVWGVLLVFLVTGGMLVVMAGDKMAKNAAELVKNELDETDTEKKD